MTEPPGVQRAAKIRAVRLALRLVVLGLIVPPGVIVSLVLALAGVPLGLAAAPALVGLGLGAAVARFAVR